MAQNNKEMQSPPGSPCLVSNHTLKHMQEVDADAFFRLCEVANISTEELKESPDNYVLRLRSIAKESIATKELHRLVTTAIIVDGFTCQQTKPETIFTLLCICSRYVTPSKVAMMLYSNVRRYNNRQELERLCTKILKTHHLGYRDLAHHLQTLALPSIAVDGENGLTHLLIQLAYMVPTVRDTLDLPPDAAPLVVSFGFYEEFRPILKIYCKHLQATLRTRILLLLEAVRRNGTGGKLALTFVELCNMMRPKKIIPRTVCCELWEALWVDTLWPLYLEDPSSYFITPPASVILRKWKRL